MVNLLARAFIRAGQTTIVSEEKKKKEIKFSFKPFLHSNFHFCVYSTDYIRQHSFAPKQDRVKKAFSRLSILSVCLSVCLSDLRTFKQHQR